MSATTAPHSELIRLETRPHQLIASSSRTVMVCDRDGMFSDPENGLFIHETRMLSRCTWRVNRGLYTAEASAVRQHSMLVYAMARPYKLLRGYSGEPHRHRARGSTEETIELRLASALSDGVHQDADVRNFTVQEQE